VRGGRRVGGGRSGGGGGGAHSEAGKKDGPGVRRVNVATERRRSSAPRVVQRR
jgi:hypothetical protein